MLVELKSRMAFHHTCTAKLCRLSNTYLNTPDNYRQCGLVQCTCEITIQSSDIIQTTYAEIISRHFQAWKNGESLPVEYESKKNLWSNFCTKVDRTIVVVWQVICWFGMICSYLHCNVLVMNAQCSKITFAQ